MILRLLATVTIVLLSLSGMQGADHYQVGDTLYVWAPSGLNMRATPSLSGKKIDKLSKCERVIIVSVSPETFSTTAVAPRPELYPDNIYHESGGTEAYVLRGNWVEIRSEKMQGYVVDVYLLKYPPPPQIIPFPQYIEMLENSPLVIDTLYSDETGQIIDAYSFEATSRLGFIYGGHHLLSSVGSGISIPEMTIEEGFIFLNYFSPMEDAARKQEKQPALQLMGREENTLWFMEDETCEISLSIEANRLYIFQGCSC